MFGNQGTQHQYAQVPHCDSDDDLRGISNPNPSQSVSSTNSITDLLRQTAARRMRQIEDTLLQSQSTRDHPLRSDHVQNDAVIPMEDDNDTMDLEDGLQHESSCLISKEMKEINLNETHAPSEDDELQYDDFVFLLSLDGSKRRSGTMSGWTVCQFKERHFKTELDDGKKVRLIYRGKMLVDSSMMKSYHIPTDGFIHVSISKNGTLYRQTLRNGESVRDSNYDDFDDGMDDEAVARRLQQQEMEMGGFGGDPFMFDRMRMRPPLAASFARRDDANEEPEMRRIRERKEFLCGMFLGSVAGIWILVFLILASRQGNYSRRFRLGITVGVAINLMIQLTFHDPVPSPDPEAVDPTAATEDSGGVGAEVPSVVEGENSAAN